MLRKITTFAFVALFALAAGAGAVAADDVIMGELLEKGCYDTQGAHGEGHADCAKRCFSRGADAGVLTADGDVIVLRAGEDASQLEALKEMAGMQVKVMGTMSEEDGEKFMTVAGWEHAAE